MSLALILVMEVQGQKQNKTTTPHSYTGHHMIRLPTQSRQTTLQANKKQKQGKQTSKGLRNIAT